VTRVIYKKKKKIEKMIKKKRKEKEKDEMRVLLVKNLLWP